MTELFSPKKSITEEAEALLSVYDHLWETNRKEIDDHVKKNSLEYLALFAHLHRFRDPDKFILGRLQDVILGNNYSISLWRKITPDDWEGIVEHNYRHFDLQLAAEDEITSKALALFEEWDNWTLALWTAQKFDDALLYPDSFFLDWEVFLRRLYGVFVEYIDMFELCAPYFLFFLEHYRSDLIVEDPNLHITTTKYHILKHQMDRPTPTSETVGMSAKEIANIKAWFEDQAKRS